MKNKTFKTTLTLIALAFTIFFIAVIVPPFMQNPDIMAAFGAGFVNPYATGYSTDVIVCWLILAVWIIYESTFLKYGWACLILGIVPGVAVGLAAYLIFRLASKEAVAG